MLDVRPSEILACFTQARRLHEGRTRGDLARLLGIRADQVAKAENGRPCGEAAHGLLLKWNGLEISRDRETAE
jgi:hypothetical protein